MDWLLTPEAWVALATLTAIEIVLGIDNIIFIAILASRLPQHLQRRARVIGLAVAMVTRVLLLLSLSWMMRLTTPLFTILGHEFSGRDLILIGGGLFLLAKSTLEIHERIEGAGVHRPDQTPVSRFLPVIIQIAILDIVFSLDSVITAIGLAKDIPVMVLAIVIAVIFMMIFAEGVSRFVDRHPTIKILALSFLLMVGLSLVGDGLGFHIPKGYVYFAMAFSVFVETINLRIRSSRDDGKTEAS